MLAAADNLARLVLHQVRLGEAARSVLGEAQENFTLRADGRDLCATGFHLLGARSSLGFVKLDLCALEMDGQLFSGSQNSKCRLFDASRMDRASTLQLDSESRSAKF